MIGIEGERAQRAHPGPYATMGVVRLIQLPAMAMSALVLLRNPGLACSSAQPAQYEYGESQMAAAVAGPFLLTLQARPFRSEPA